MLQSLHDLIQNHLDAWLGVLAALIPILVSALAYLFHKILQESEKKRSPKIAVAEEERHQKNYAIEVSKRQKDYIDYVIADPRITKIQIAGMNTPLDLLDIYVHLRIHLESTLWFSLDPVLRDAEETSEPDALLIADQKSLQHRVNEALDPIEALRRYKRCVIVGDPGTGKTTLLRYLTLKAARKELDELPSFPIYVQTNTFDAAVHRDFHGLLLAQLGEFSKLPDAREQLQALMKAGQIMLLLDGLDETRVGSTNDRTEGTYTWLVDTINTLSALYINMPIVAAVRKAGYQHRPKLQGFHELEIVNFRPEDSRAFITKWFTVSKASKKEEKIQDLHARLERSLRMQSLASNPLLLSLIVIVYDGHLHLPERRADLYKQCIEVLQTRWDASRDISRRRDFPLIFQSPLLQEVAWHFHNQNKRYFPVEELLEVIGKFLPTVDIAAERSQDVLDQIAIENGLLREQAKGWYGFSHLTFQEYFVTQYIITNQRLDVLLDHLQHPWWEEVLLLYVGSVNDASRLLNILLGHDKQFPLQDDMFLTYLILAGRSLAEKPRVLKHTLRNEIINRLLEALQTTSYVLTRERIANILAMMDVARVNNRLLNILASADQANLEIRESIGRAFGLSGERSLARELAHILAQPQLERYIRITIARTLGALGNPEITTGLLTLLRNEHEDPFVRQSVATTLGMLGNEQLLPDLLHLCQNTHEHAMVLQSLVIALGNLGHPQCLATLHTMLLEDHLVWYVRGSVAKVLGNFGKAESIAPMFKVLENKDEDPYVRRCIALALGSFPSSLIPLEHLHMLLLNKEIDSSIQGSIASTFATHCQQTDNVRPLLQLLANQDVHPLVRMNIATALGLQGQSDTRVIAQLEQIYRDECCHYELWACTVSALGMLGIAKMHEDLLTLIADPQLPHDILPHIVQALTCLTQHNRIDKQEISSCLIELLEDEALERYRGQCMLKVISTLREQAIVPDLLKILQHPTVDRYIRQSVAETIAQLAQDEESAAILLKILPTTDITDDIYRTLWIVSRHAKRVQV